MGLVRLKSKKFGIGTRIPMPTPGPKYGNIFVFRNSGRFIWFGARKKFGRKKEKPLKNITSKTMTSTTFGLNGNSLLKMTKESSGAPNLKVRSF